MKLSLLGALALALPLTLLASRFASAQDAQGTEAPAMDMKAMMEMMRLAQPGPEHEELAKGVGEWEQSIEMMMPGMPPMTQTGTSKAEMILGNRFLEVTASGSMMGMPVESRSIIGFDRRHEVYTIVALDTMGTYYVTGKGVKEEDGVIRMHGRDDDPMGEQIYTFEVERISEDEQEYRILFTKMGGMEWDEPQTIVRVRSKRKK